MHGMAWHRRGARRVAERPEGQQMRGAAARLAAAVILLLISFLAPLHADAQYYSYMASQLQPPSDQPVREGSFIIQGNEDRYSFKTLTLRAHPEWVVIEIKRPGTDASAVQRIAVELIRPMTSDTFKGFMLQDVDLDGDWDLVVPAGGTTGHEWSKLYLFDPNTHQFTAFPDPFPGALRGLRCFQPKSLSPEVIGSTCPADGGRDPEMRVFRIAGSKLLPLRTLTVHFSNYDVSEREYNENHEAVYDNASEAVSERTVDDGIEPRVLCELVIPRRVEGHHKRFGTRIERGENSNCGELSKFVHDVEPK